MTRYLLIFLIAITCASSQDLRFRRVGLDEGLPQSYVNQIAQDAQGFLWIGTQDGLARFDGRRMDVYRHVPGDSTTITGNNAFDLFLGADSLLYASTGNGQCWFDASTRQWHRVRSFMKPRRLQQGGLRQVHDGSVNVTYTDRSGRVWVASAREGLSMTDPQTRSMVHFGSREDNVRRLACDDVWALCEDARGRMWVGLNGGGIAIIENACVVARYRHAPSVSTSLSNNVVRVLFEDDAGTMWIGTHGGGLCQYDPYRHALPLLQPTQRELGIESNAVRGITTSGDVMYVGLRTGVLVTDTMLRRSSLLVSWANAYDRIGAARALHVDRRGTLWIGSERQGLGIVQAGSRTVRWLQMRDDARPLRQTVSCIIPDDSLHLLIGTDDGVARIHMRTFDVQWYDVPPSPTEEDPHVTVSAITRLSNGEYVLGTAFGLYRGPLGAWTRKIPCADEQCVRPNIDVIRSIDIDSDRAYVATWGGGIRCIDLRTGREYVVDARNGLPSNTVYAVYRYGRDQLVASTNAGIVVWNLTSRRVERHLTASRGAQSAEYNSWSHWRINPSTLVFGGINGLNIFQPASIGGTPTPRVLIETIGREPDDVRYVGRVIALSDASPVVVRVALHADDTVWYETSNPDVLRSTLAPGEYTLRMQARYTDGAYGPVASHTVSIPEPLWQTWWFVAGMLLVGAGGVWRIAGAVTRRRDARAQEAERLVHNERVRIARDLHDDVGTGLAKIVIMAENSIADTDDDVVRSIADTAQDVIDSVRSIVWVMKANDQRLSATIGYVHNKVSDLMAGKGITYAYDESLARDHELDTITMRNVVLAVQEIATNIVRHSNATSVSVYVRDTNDVLTIDVRDDGRGFDEHTASMGSGISNICERMDEVGGSVAIDSYTSNGTRIVLTIPLHRRA